MHLHGTNRLALVARVSTADQEEGTSLESQIEKLRLLAQLHDYVVPEDAVYSGDESGRLPLHQRPIISQVLADAARHKFDAVAFYKLDRMARRLKFILELWDRFESLGIKVLIVDPMIDTATPVGRLIRNVLGAVAEFEVDQLLERTSGERQKKLARGEGWLSGRHYGYRYQKASKLAGTVARITVHEAEAEVVRRIYRRRAQAASYYRIATELTADGIAAPKTKPGEAPRAWAENTVRWIVTNEAYKGTAFWGKHECGRSKSGGRTSRLRRDGRALIPIAYPPIVTPEEWGEANAVSHRGVCAVRASLERYLLRGGLVQCAEHGRGMSGSGSGRGEPRYRCVQQMGGERARRTSHGVPGAPLDDAVWSAVAGFLADPTRGLAQARRLAQETAQRLEGLEREHDRLQETLTGLERQVANLRRHARLGTFSDAEITVGMEEIAQERAALLERLEPLQAQIALAKADLPQAGEIETVCQRLAGGLVYGTAEEKRSVLDELGVQVLMHGLDYLVTGAVPGLQTRGSLAALTSSSSWSTAGLHPRGFLLWGSLKEGVVPGWDRWRAYALGMQADAVEQVIGTAQAGATIGGGVKGG